MSLAPCLEILKTINGITYTHDGSSEYNQETGITKDQSVVIGMNNYSTRLLYSEKYNDYFGRITNKKTYYKMGTVSVVKGSLD